MKKNKIKGTTKNVISKNNPAGLHPDIQGESPQYIQKLLFSIFSFFIFYIARKYVHHQYHRYFFTFW